MEVKLRNRSRLMMAITLFGFLTLVWAYAQLEWRLPQAYASTHVVTRGSVLAADGTVLAKTVGDRRVYPQGKLAGQLIGMMGTDRGLEGIEAYYEEQLARGGNVTLTIDPQLQGVAESVLARAVREREGKFGSVVALDVKTGRVLAAASYPPFDPNDWRSYDPEFRRNRPFTDLFEPGSTVKALVVGALIEEGLTTPNTGYSTPMRRKVDYKVIHDVVQHPEFLSTQQILRYSSNVGMSHLVEHFDPSRMHEYLSSFGFGQEVDMPGLYTADGLLRSWQRWDAVSKVNYSFGQGLSSSVLQLAAAYNAVANGGLYVAPQVVLEEAAGEERQVLKPETAQTVREMLRAVVEDGIPHAAGIPGYSLAGKTGTAQVVENGRYSHTLYDSVFAGFFPADEPRVTLAVMVHGAPKGFQGSQLAAPIYRDIAAEVFSQWAYPPKTHE